MNNQLQKVTEDEFGRPNGIALINKPIGYTSHDVVNILRKKYNTKKIGHAGALDPFASGLLICVVGKATKYQDDFLLMDKTYEAEVLFGIKTDSGDTEGMPLNYELKIMNYELGQIEQALKSFQPGYEQYVPVFSSVKVDGQKLRVLARSWDSFETFYEDSLEGATSTSRLLSHSDQVKKVKFIKGDNSKIINLPKKNVKIYGAEVLEVRDIDVKFSEDDTFKYENADEGAVGQPRLLGEIYIPNYLQVGLDKLDLTKGGLKLQVAKIRVSCSKGTYIRQLGEDLGEKLGVPSMLISLKRTRVGEFRLEDAEEIISSNSGSRG